MNTLPNRPTLQVRVISKDIYQSMGDFVHGWGPSKQDYVMLELNGKRWCVTVYQDALMVVDPENIEKLVPEEKEDEDIEETVI